MARYLTIAILAFAAMAAGFTQAGGDKDKEFRVQGKLTKDDPKDQQRGGPSHTHAVPMKAGKVYTIDMVSKDFDSYLRLLDPKGNQLEEDDDSGLDLNARIIFNCTKDGEYKIACTSFGPNATGAYTLTVKLTGTAAAQPSTSHARMIGKDAPDFAADFAVNGKAVTLAELKGKIVLLHFCDVRSSSSVALLPRLNTWEKAYQSKGLAIVGITFYPSDINQALGLDETGAVKTVKASDRKSDQALLGAFAAHHKVGHLLLALPKQNALDTFDAYVVNGVPQMVLIDRKGIIRLIDVGGEKGTANVESEIKKLLAEK